MIHDISPLLSPRLKVWPGDTVLTREIRLDLARGDAVTLSTLRATAHLGAHADAPSHYGAAAPAIHEQPLDLYLGPCQVIEAPVPRGSVLTPDTLDLGRLKARRVLFATHTFPDPEHFNDDFASLSPDLITFLHAKGVRLIGIDTPSVDPFYSSELAAHKKCLEHDIAILEGLVLKNVRAGIYILVALPLKLEGFDASPVRAVLIGKKD
jgi:arylformamidase